MSVAKLDRGQVALAFAAGLGVGVGLALATTLLWRPRAPSAGTILKSLLRDCGEGLKRGLEYDVENSQDEGTNGSKEEDILRLGKLLGAAKLRFEVTHMPTRIILVRHGQSEGNVDEAAYEDCPDNKIRLTQKGRAQAFEAGKRLANIIGDESMHIFFSPYMRTRETMVSEL